MEKRMADRGRFVLGREFPLPNSNSSGTSQVIAQTADAELVKPDDASASKKFARYVPFWG